MNEWLDNICIGLNNIILVIVLLGPQVRYQKSQVDALVNGRIPVEVIDMRLYGIMNGKAILKQALDILRK